MKNRYPGCAESGCNYYWQDEDEYYPRCHYEDFGKAPCEEDDWNDGDCEQLPFARVLGSGFLFVPGKPNTIPL